MRKLFAFLVGLAACTGASAQSGLEAQRAAMARLAWMAGAWEGTSTIQERDGEKSSLSHEWIRLAGGGLAVMIQGRHYRKLPDGGRGEVVLDTAGMMTYDPAAKKYRFITQLQDGRGGIHDAVMQGDTLSWRIDLNNAHVRYDITRSARGEWSELGYFCRDGAACVPFFKMLLERKGDAP
ncbi:MAG TPA: hypothetical protein VK996_15855 [Ramlibacter sp.]|nr:hypothetical protein [Ramlibacter sp.]